MIKLLLSRLHPRSRTSAGQSFVELALTLPLVIFLTLGVIDFGYILYAHVQVAAASGEGAIVGSRIAVDGTEDQGDNDEVRNNAIRNRVVGALGRLNPSTPNFDPSSTSYINIQYQTTSSNTRIGEEIAVTVRYRQRILFNLVPNLIANEFFTVSSTTRARVQ